MFTQYYPQRFRIGASGRPEGSIRPGEIIRINPRDPEIVEAWIPRDYTTVRDGRYTTVRIRGGHLAMVRSLRNGRRRLLADHWIRAALD